MASISQRERYTPEQYLELEVQSDRKHEYHRGDIFAMSGGSPEHSKIKINLYRLVGNHLDGKPCEIYDADMRVKVSENGLYTYPDASVACPPIEIEKAKGAETLLNPVAVFEVLSPSTQNYDRGVKFNLMSQRESLREYFLISQDAAVIERRSKDRQGDWKLTVVSGLDAAITVESIDCELPLKQLYNKIELPPPYQEPHDGPAT